MLKLPPPGPDNLDFLYNLGLHNVDLGLLGRGEVIVTKKVAGHGLSLVGSLVRR